MDKNLEKCLKMTVFGWFLVVFSHILAHNQGSENRELGTGNMKQKEPGRSEGVSQVSVETWDADD